MTLKKLILISTFSILFISSLKASEVQMPKLEGDLRFRNDRQDKDGTDGRYRQRIRARLSAKGSVEENVKYQIRFTTGSTDPVSGNQSLNTGFSTKGANFDILSIKYKFKKLPLKITAGKMKNPLFRPGKTELLWDGDLTPEGINFHSKLGMMFVNLGYFYAEERSSGPDTIMHSAQVGMKVDKSNWKLTTALSYFDYLAIKGRSGLFDSTDGFGNSTTTSGSNQVYDKDYAIAEFSTQLELKNLNTKLFLDAVRNTAVNRAHSGYLVGFSFGKKLKFKYNYRRIEADAVVGAFTDSDFKGGGTDGKGHELGLSYKLSKKQKLGFSHFLNKTALLNGKNYNRTFLDYSLKF